MADPAFGQRGVSRVAEATTADGRGLEHFGPAKFWIFFTENVHSGEFSGCLSSYQPKPCRLRANVLLGFKHIHFTSVVASHAIKSFISDNTVHIKSKDASAMQAMQALV